MRRGLAAMIVLVALVFAALIFPALSAPAGDLDQARASCDDGNSGQTTEALQRLSQSLPPILGLAMLSDVPEFCRINGYRDGKDSFPREMPDFITYNDWVGGFIATQDGREALFKRMINSYVIEKAQSAQPLNAGEVSQCDQEISKFRKKPAQQGDEVRATFPEAVFLCSDVTYLHAPQCARSMKFLYRLVDPRNDVNLVRVWKTVLDNPVYVQVIKEVALKNLALIQSGGTPSSRFFDDLNQAFFERLHDRKTATQDTFNLLGVVSSDGPNSYEYAPCAIPTSVSMAIRILDLSSMVLDQRTAKRGFLYSYPRGVGSLCDYGKNYHFWMSAFLAREAARRFGDPVAAAAAAFTLDKGYQFMKVGGGRDPTRAFKENTFSNYNNNMRLDLTQAAAGAWFGAMSLDPKKRSLSRKQFDTGLRKIFEGAHQSPQDPNFVFPSPNQPIKILSAYSTWKKTINPDSAFKYFESQMGQ